MIASMQIAGFNNAIQSNDSVSSPQPKIVQLVHPKLTQLIQPPIMHEERHYSSDRMMTHVLHRNYQFAKEHLVRRFSILGGDLRAFENFDFTKLNLTAQGRESFSHTIEIMGELATGNYDEEGACTYFGWASRLFINHLSGGAVSTATRVETTAKMLTQPNACSFVERSDDERGHSMSWTMMSENMPIAILKESAVVKVPEEIEAKQLDGSVEKVPLKIALHDPLCFSSFLKHLPSMALPTKVNDYELIGYEMDALLGLDLVPVSYKAHFVNCQQQVVEGTLQLFVPDGKPAGSTYIFEKNRAVELTTLHVAKVQKAAISGILKGLTAHHMDNYLMRSRANKIDDVVEIDLEELMLPFNRIPDDVTPSFAQALIKQKEELLKLEQTSSICEQIALIDQRIQTIKKSIILCRLWIMGLPQTKKPLDRALLLILTHPSMRALLEAYHAQSPLDKAALEAQVQRLQILQAMSREELKKPRLQLTARDCYFAIFGGREIYELAKVNGYADLAAFNNVVSDPYQHVLKDYSRPETMAPSDILQPIAEHESEARKIVKQNLQSLEPFYG